jgi:hypothetical protein
MKSKFTTVTARRALVRPSSKTSATKTSSKRDLILDLLRRKQGASLDEMQKVSGWQAHSVRGFLAGTVKKRLGLKLTSNKSDDSERHYFVTQA